MGRALLRFALLGAALFAAGRWWAGSGPEPLVIPAARLEARAEALARRAGRPPGPAEREAALAAEVEEALLYREAEARGYARDDPVVFRRLVQNLRFAGADPERDDAALYAEALALDLHRTDTVVRRRMAQRLRLDLEARALADPPDEAELRAHYARHRDAHRSPARVRLVQVYFARGREAEAARTLAALERGDDAGPAHGDPFLHPPEQPSQTREELAARFGAEFAAAAFALEPGVWSGPLASAFGLHLVRVDEREPERALGFEEVRERVRHAVLAERRRRALERGLGALGEGVAVRVERASDGSGAPAP